jgi:hypothetical protein
MTGLARVMACYPEFPVKVLTNENITVTIPRLTTGYFRLDQYMMVTLSRYEVQMARMGAGKDPKLDMSVWRAVWHTVKHLGLNAFKPRRT